MDLKSKKTVFLAAGFGTSDPEEYQRTYGTLADRILSRCPGAEIEIALTSCRVSDRLFAKTGTRPASFPEALERAMRKGAGEIRILPLFVLEGSEYDRLRALAEAAPEGAGVLTGRPLLAGDHLERTALFLASELNGHEEEAVIYISHGAGPAADASCRMLEDRLRAMGHANVWITDLGRGPSSLLKDLAERPVRQVLLRPLLLTAGHHWKKDVWGKGDDTWRSCLVRAGYRVSGEGRGLLEREEILDILLQGFWDR